jgi:hypothetical protein
MFDPRPYWKTTAVLLLVGFSSPSWGDEDVRVFVDPAPRLAVGESAWLHVRVEGVGALGLAAFQLSIAYDPEVASIRDPNAAFVAAGLDAFAPLGSVSLCAPIRGEAACGDSPWLLTSTGREALGRTDVDSAAGRLSIAYATSGTASAATGDGAIAILEVVSVSGEPIDLHFEDVILTDASDPPRVYPIEVESAARSRSADARGDY